MTRSAARHFGRNPTALAIAVFVLIVVAAFALSAMSFPAAARFIHVGAFIGTMMAANVFSVIIPNQRRITAALLRGETPDPRLGAIGKQRSLHNTYLTLPVLLMMISNHYPMLTGHPQAWMLVALILVAGAAIRHFLVRHEVGDPAVEDRLDLAGHRPWRCCWPLILTAPRSDAEAPALQVSDERVIEITQTHCAMCHSVHPADEAFVHAPKECGLRYAGGAAPLRRADPGAGRAVQRHAAGQPDRHDGGGAPGTWCLAFDATLNGIGTCLLRRRWILKKSIIWMPPVLPSCSAMWPNIRPGWRESAGHARPFANRDAMVAAFVRRCHAGAAGRSARLDPGPSRSGGPRRRRRRTDR